MEENLVKNDSVTAFDGILDQEDPRSFDLFSGRLHFFVIAFILAAIAIISLVIWDIYCPEAKFLAEIDDEVSITWNEVEPERGTIYSDNRQVLAADFLSYSLRFDPFADGIDNPLIDSGLMFQNNYKEFAAALSHILKDKTPKEYEQLMEKLYDERSKDKKAKEEKDRPRRNILMVKQRISPADLIYLKSHSKLIRKYDSYKSGIMIIPFKERKYPNGDIAKRTIGLQTSKGAETGLEKSLDYRLSGKKGVHKSRRITSKVWTSEYDDYNFDAQNGWDVITTLNVDLQKFVQETMAKYIRINDADWGTAIVMDVPTGDIKAVANVIFDHNKDTIFVEQSDSTHYAIHQRIEPGSTFKTVVFTALLERKNLSLDEIFDTGDGKKWFSRAHLTVTDDHQVGAVTFKQVLEQSSNVGMAMAVERHCSSSKQEMQALDDIIAGFGILNTLDLDLPTTIKPLMRSPKDKLWSYSDFITQSFGYAVNLTPMHIAMFYNAIANNGVMVNPRFVTSYEESRDHKTILTNEVKVLNPKLCSDQALAKVRQSLEGVVLNGTGRKALAGCKFKCAGKTGTAKVSRGRKGYVQGNVLQTYYGTFVGYFPADKPRYTVYVGFQTRSAKGSGKPWAGAQLSAPAFKEIADYIYETENIKNSNVRSQYVVSKHSRMNASIGNYSDLKLICDSLKIKLSAPSKSSDAMIGIDTTGIVVRKPTIDSTGTINFTGYSLCDALDVAYSHGMKATVIGEGNVYKHEISTVNGKKVVTLYLN